MEHETLGENIVPLRYKILLKPDLSQFVSEGEEEIEIKVKKATNKIVLNSVGLKIKSASVVWRGKKYEGKVQEFASKQQISIEIEKAILGTATLKINFEGRIGDTLNGLYRSSYTYANKRQYILTTQFESVDARRAFPCFDEPAFKATFDISLLVDKNLSCVSNMPILNENVQGSKKIVTFEKTPPMSTYLVYIGVGDFEFIESSYNGKPIRAITVKGKKNLAKVGLEYAKKFLAFYENYFGIRYPLPKLDLLAIPDFAAGAMENWGAITFRETDFLCEENSPIETKQKVAITIAHELAHQWFGDLVTMKWWNDLWLNESFATFMSYKAVDATFPEWSMKDQYALDTINTALVQDAYINTHPISVKVNTPGEISSIFDAISYEKGGSVLNMLEDYVGPEMFRKGIASYLKKHAYSNAEAKDLWSAIANASKNKFVQKLMQAWLSKSGYPMLVEEKGKVEQKRFLTTALKSDTWPVPVRYATESGAGLFLMKGATAKLPKFGNWIKLNYGQKGLYRVAYSKPLLEKLIDLAKSDKLSSRDYWGIENDLFALVRGGMLSLDDYLEKAERLLEIGFPANESLLSHLTWLYIMFYQTEKAKDVEKVLEKHASLIIGKLGLMPKKKENPIDKTIRLTAMISKGMIGDEKIEELVRKEFKAKLQGRQVNPDLRDAVYELTAWNGGVKEFESLLNAYEREQVPDEKISLLASLPMFRKEELVNRALALSLTDKVRLQDKFILPSRATENPYAHKILVRWTFDNWQRLKKSYLEGTMMLRRFVMNLGVIKERSELRQFDMFFAKKENIRDDIKREAALTREKILANIAMLDKSFKL
mgnify:FL=1